MHHLIRILDTHPQILPLILTQIIDFGEKWYGRYEAGRHFDDIVAKRS